MAISAIPSVWGTTTNQSVRWALGKNHKLYDNGFSQHPHLSTSAVTLVIGIRLADLFPPGTIDIATIVPTGCDYRVVGPHNGGRVCRQDLHKITLLCSPKPATGPQERQVQQLNYDTFICVMAEMVKKYAPKVIKHKEI